MSDDNERQKEERPTVSAILDAGTRIDLTQALGEAALARLEQEAHDAEQRIQAALHALVERTGHFRRFTEAANGALSAAAAHVVSMLDAAQEVRDAAGQQENDPEQHETPPAVEEV